MPLLFLSGSALTLGFLHGLGADHLMAIAALAIDRRGRTGQFTHVVRTAVGFACGHMLVLGVGVGIALALGWVVPAAVTSGAERFGGLLLLLLGVAGLSTVASGRAYGHIHQERDGAARWHVHFSWRHAPHIRAHAHSSVPALMGAVFAVSSLRALMLLAPFGHVSSTESAPVVLLLVALFGLGILISMSLFGVVLARLVSLRAVAALGRAAGVLVATASMLLGMYWIVAI